MTYVFDALLLTQIPFDRQLLLLELLGPDVVGRDGTELRGGYGASRDECLERQRDNDRCAADHRASRTVGTRAIWCCADGRRSYQVDSTRPVQGEDRAAV